jgi:chaperonin GroEL (HSP60 family)
MWLRGLRGAQVGDGSNFVIVFAGELLHQARELLQMGLHPRYSRLL